MKEVKILHLFPRLLSLYGEYGNVAILKHTLEEKGYTVTVTQCEDGNADYSAYDFIYVGSGTEDNLMVALERLAPYVEAVKASIEGGKVWLATGNAMTFFGKIVRRGEQTVPGVGTFGYETTIDDGKRFLGDVLTAGEKPSLGFINTSCVYSGIENPLLTLCLGKNLGNDKSSNAEGIREGSFFGTQLIGPFLVKNPHFLQEVYTLLTGEELEIAPEDYIAKAYQVALQELSARAEI